MRVRNWAKWQSYRSDRGQPPWIKLHRALLRNPEWVGLTDAQRGQLASLWMLAADREGKLPDDPEVIRKLCFLDALPDIETFLELGFLELDTSPIPAWRRDDASVTYQSRDRVETESEQNRVKADTEASWLPSGSPNREEESRPLPGGFSGSQESELDDIPF